MTKIRLVFATNNENKVKEIQELLGADFEIKSLKDIGFFEDIPETADSLEGNADLKAKHIHFLHACNVFADDTGLEVDALDGAPGVFSARFAGEQKNSEDNMNKLLEELEGASNRAAQFRTAISLILDGKHYLFEGKVRGTILTEKRGEEGFGYDPIFQAEGYSKSFAEMSMDEKNKISHRGRAIGKMIQFLKEAVPGKT